MRRSILLLLVAATGCGIFDRVFGRDDLTVLRRNQGKWRSLGIVDYDFTYNRLCYCGFTGPVRIAVLDAVVTGVTNIATNQPIELTWWPTVDSLFVWSERNLKSGYKLDITYDGAFHFPGKVVGDLPMAIDDEYTSTANKLVRVAK